MLPPDEAGGTVAPPEEGSEGVNGATDEPPDDPDESDEDEGSSDWNAPDVGLLKSTTNGGVRSVPVPGSVPTGGGSAWLCTGTIARLSTPSVTSAEPSTWNVIVVWSADNRPPKW